MTKNMSIVLVAVLAAVMVVGTLAVTLETGQAFAFAGNGGDGGDGSSTIGVNGGHGGHGAHDPCDNAGPAEHNPHC